MHPFFERETIKWPPLLGRAKGVLELLIKTLICLCCKGHFFEQPAALAGFGPRGPGHDLLIIDLINVSIKKFSFTTFFAKVVKQLRGQPHQTNLRLSDYKYLRLL